MVYLIENSVLSRLMHVRCEVSSCCETQTFNLIEWLKWENTMNVLKSDLKCNLFTEMCTVWKADALSMCTTYGMLMRRRRFSFPQSSFVTALVGFGR